MNTTSVIWAVIFVIAIIAIGPLATIWALNTLFPSLAIPVNLNTWMATFLLSAVVSGHGLSFTTKK